MRTFKDMAGREWKIDLLPPSVIRIRDRSEGKFDLTKPNRVKLDGRPLWQTLDASDELETIWELLCYVIEPQAEAAGVTAEEFGRAMAGEVLLDARAAFFDAWETMFHALGQPSLARAVRKIANARAEALKLARRQLRRARS